MWFDVDSVEPVWPERNTHIHKRKLQTKKKNNIVENQVNASSLSLGFGKIKSPWFDLCDEIEWLHDTHSINIDICVVENPVQILLREYEYTNFWQIIAIVPIPIKLSIDRYQNQNQILRMKQNY